MGLMARAIRRLITRIQTSETASLRINELQKLELVGRKTKRPQAFREFGTFFLGEGTIEAGSNHIDTIRRNDPPQGSENCSIGLLT